MKSIAAIPISLSCWLLPLARVLLAQDGVVLPDPKPTGLPDVSDLGDVRIGPHPAAPSSTGMNPGRTRSVSPFCEPPRVRAKLILPD